MAPRQGVTANAARIAKAVDDEEWQKFRVSLKGLPTIRKVELLRKYFVESTHKDKIWRGAAVQEHLDNNGNCDVCIRVDNYIKALCRGGQLYAGESLKTALNSDWNLLVKK